MRYIALAMLLIGFSQAQARSQTSAPSPAASATPAPTATAAPLVWQTFIIPYVWLPNLSAQMTFEHPAIPSVSLPSGTANIVVRVAPSSYLSDLNFAAMLSAYARRGDLSLGADYIYMNMSTNKASVVSVIDPNTNVEVPVNVSTHAHQRGTIATFDAGMRLTTSDVSPIEFFGGVRYLGTTMSADWTFTGALESLPKSGSASKNLYVWDPIVGFRGTLGLGGHWHLPYYVDYGAGSNNTSNQEYAGVGYSQPWGDIVLVNRWLQYNFTTNAYDSLQMAGPALGVRIRF